MNKKPTAEWNSCEECQEGDVLNTDLLNEFSIDTTQQYNEDRQQPPPHRHSSSLFELSSTLRSMDSGILASVDSLATYR